MKEALSNRIADVKAYLDDQLTSEVSQRWWHTRVNDYIPTRDMAKSKNYSPQDQEITIIKYDLKGALKSSALFFMISFFMYLFIGGKESLTSSSFWMINIVLLLAICSPLLSGKRSAMRMVFTKEGFQVSDMPVLVTWENLVVSYIRVDHSGEDDRHYLLLFYYDETTDEFREIECALNGLDMPKEDIAYRIEYYKIRSGPEKRGW